MLTVFPPKKTSDRHESEVDSEKELFLRVYNQLKESNNGHRRGESVRLVSDDGNHLNDETENLDFSCGGGCQYILKRGDTSATGRDT